jgi:predicted phage replisome organizer
MADVKWFKLTTDMFDDEKIKIIESMPDRDTILIIWIKLIGLAAKINANGWLFLTEEVPYDEDTLATVLNRPVNTVRLAMGLFTKYKMIETGDDGTLFITNFEKHQNIEGLERIREQGRLRTARFREKQKLLPGRNVTSRYSNAPDKNREDKNREEEEEEKETTTAFNDYKEKLRIKYPELNIDEEWERCQIWYRDHKKKTKSPSLALGNWCRKEMAIRQEKRDENRFGKVRQPGDYTRPDELRHSEPE